MVRERHRPFVGGDDVGLAFERGADVRHRWFAAIDVEHRGLDASPAAPRPHRPPRSATWRITSMPLRSRGEGSSRSSDCRPSTMAMSARAYRRPPDPRRCRGAAWRYPRPSSEVEPIGGLIEQAHEAPRDVAEADRTSVSSGWFMRAKRWRSADAVAAIDTEQVAHPDP